MLWKALGTVTLFTSLMAVLVYSGIFSTVHIELGLKHYAEKLNNFNMFFPKFVKMPLNTAVNIGYILIGAYWCAMTTVCLENKVITAVDAYIAYVFNIASAFYGGVQALRIITQIQEFGVMDQWSTLPFFMMVYVWGSHISSGWNGPKFLCLFLGSLSSYGLTLISPIGFEITLGLHIFLALIGGIIAYRKHPNQDAQAYFVLALLSCAGFVVLKLLDLELAKHHELFNKISGHFLSKVADILQIHFVNEFFRSILARRYNASKEERKKKKD